MDYLMNAWYMIAWSTELSDQLLSRTILDTPILLFRDAGDGSLRAMEDKCPHRFAPLSRGLRVDGNIRCGYHGLSFNSDGQCVHNPFTTAVPSAAQVRTFPIAEKTGAIWVWTGDAALADIDRLPAIDHRADPEMTSVCGFSKVLANYQLVSDNLMDLTHTAFLHPGLGGEHYFPKFKSWEEGDGIVSDYVIEDIPNFLGEMMPSDRVTHHDHIRWDAPSTHMLTSFTIAHDDPGVRIDLPSAHILTPETATSTHYFWSSAQPKDSPLPDEELTEILRAAFDDEDKPMVEAVQARMGTADLWDLGPVLLPTDAGNVRVRRRLAALIAREKTMLEDRQIEPAGAAGRAA